MGLNKIEQITDLNQGIKNEPHLLFDPPILPAPSKREKMASQLNKKLTPYQMYRMISNPKEGKEKLKKMIREGRVFPEGQKELKASPKNLPSELDQTGATFAEKEYSRIVSRMPDLETESFGYGMNETTPGGNYTDDVKIDKLFRGSHADTTTNRSQMQISRSIFRYYYSISQFAYIGKVAAFSFEETFYSRINDEEDQPKYPVLPRLHDRKANTETEWKKNATGALTGVRIPLTETQNKKKHKEMLDRLISQQNKPSYQEQEVQMENSF